MSRYKADISVFVVSFVSSSTSVYRDRQLYGWKKKKYQESITIRSRPRWPIIKEKNIENTRIMLKHRSLYDGF